MSFEDTWKARDEIEPRIDETPDRKHFYSFLVGVNRQEVRDRLEEVQSQLEKFKCVDNVPRDYFHITVKMAGFLVDNPSQGDEIGEDQLDEIKQQADSIVEDFEPFEVRLKNLNIFPTAVISEVHEARELDSLNRRFKQIDQLLTFRKEYLPHTSIAHFQSKEAFQSLLEKLEQLREQEFGTVEVDEIRLIHTDFRKDKLGFETVERFKL